VRTKEILFRSSEKLKPAQGLKYLESFFQAQKDGIESMRARSKVTYEDEKGKIKLDSYILFKNPSCLRFEMLNIFDQPLFILNFYNDELFLYSVEDNLFEYRSKYYGNLGYIFTNFDFFFPFLLSNFEPLKNYSLEESIAFDSGKFVEFRLKNLTGKGYIEVSLLLQVEENKVIRLKYVDLSDRVNRRIYEITYFKYEEVGSCFFPSIIGMRISVRGKTRSIRMNFKDIKVNEEIKQDKFVFTIPDYAIRGEIPRVFDWLN